MVRTFTGIFAGCAKTGAHQTIIGQINALRSTTSLSIGDSFENPAFETKL
jgi:hypothetical protein